MAANGSQLGVVMGTVSCGRSVVEKRGRPLLRLELSSLTPSPPSSTFFYSSSRIVLSPTTTPPHAVRQEAICLCGEEEGFAFGRVLWTRHCQRRGIPLRLPNLHYRAMVIIPFGNFITMGYLYVYSTGYAIAVLLLTLSRCLLGTSSIR